MNQYWENLWDNSTITEYMGYVYGLSDIDSSFIQIFHQHKIHSVCDAACGYGKYSALLYSNGFDVSGFDIAESSIHLTKQILHFLGMDSIISNYTTADIQHTKYNDNFFDAVVAHAIIDHLPLQDAICAIHETTRIVKPNGLVYLSFSGSDAEILKENKVPLQSLNREGLLYQYYSNEEIKEELLKNQQIIYFETNSLGDRDIIIQKA